MVGALAEPEVLAGSSFARAHSRPGAAGTDLQHSGAGTAWGAGPGAQRLRMPVSSG